MGVNEMTNSQILTAQDLTTQEFEMAKLELGDARICQLGVVVL